MHNYKQSSKERAVNYTCQNIEQNNRARGAYLTWPAREQHATRPAYISIRVLRGRTVATVSWRANRLSIIPPISIEKWLNIQSMVRCLSIGLRFLESLRSLGLAYGTLNIHARYTRRRLKKSRYFITKYTRYCQSIEYIWC